jgi:hypothetical protein
MLPPLSGLIFVRLRTVWLYTYKQTTWIYFLSCNLPITQPTYFKPEDGSSMLLRNVSNSYRTRRCYVSEDHNLKNRRSENLKTWVKNI